MNITLQSVIQSLLAVIGGFLALKGVGASEIAQGAGIIMGIVSVIWSIVEKNANGNQIIAAVSTALTFAGGLLIAAGKLSSGQVQIYSGIATSLLTAILNIFHIPILNTTSTTGVSGVTTTITPLSIANKKTN